MKHKRVKLIKSGVLISIALSSDLEYRGFLLQFK